MLSTPLRNALATVSNGASNDLAALWRQVESAVQAREALHDLLPGIVSRYGMAASALAAQWYDDIRAKQGVGGLFRAIPADIPDAGTHALIGWAESQAATFETFQDLLLGGTQRRITNFARETVRGSSLSDSRAIGWQREGVGSCAFCRMLIGRGAVYSKSTVTFASHDHCQCVAVPAFDGRPLPVRLDADGKRLDFSSRRTRTQAGQREADNARIRDWIAANPNAG